jgi:hypothetical protein
MKPAAPGVVGFREGFMAYYRLYFFDGAGGHITGVAEFEAHSDPAAIAAAEATRGIAPMELCQIETATRAGFPKPPRQDWNGSRVRE